jgi:type VI secretion system ImpC/EvpB family protein
MPGVANEPLRTDVLAGRFFGRAAAATDVAAFVAGGSQISHLRTWFGDDWVRQTLSREHDRSDIVRAALDRDIAAIDALISAQLDAVLHHARLRRLEGSWRGLMWLVDRLPPAGGRVRVKLLQVRWQEVCRDIERAAEFDQSNLFRKIYEEQFGTAGGEPFGLIAADYELQHRPTADHPTDDVSALTGLASIAAAAFSPMIFGASPELLGLDNFADASTSLDFVERMRGPDYRRWRSAAELDDSRFVGIAMPRMLGRAPWADDGSRVDRFRYRAYTPGAAQRVWTSCVFGFAAVVVRAFDRYSWPAEVRGADIASEARGGVLDDLPFERFPSDPPNEPPPRAPLELAFTDDQETGISQANMIPLSALEHLPEASFGILPSIHRPPRMTTAIADANQRQSAQLNTLLCVSRFAHCVKLMGREMVGSFLEPSEVENRLQRWLNKFISGIGSGGFEVTAKYPLQQARVEVNEKRGRPGVYSCTVHLMPNHQLDEVGASFRFVTEFAPRQSAA